MTKWIAVCGLLLCFGFQAQAQGDGPCAKDREALCGSIKPGGGAIINCMKENKDKLSEQCKMHLETMKHHMNDMKDACKADAEKFCSDQRPGKGRLMRCMRDNKEKLSAECKAEMEQAKQYRKGKKGN